MNRHIHKLALVSDAPYFGGAERYMVAMARAALRRGIDARIHWLPMPIANPSAFVAPQTDGLEVRLSPADRTHSVSGLVTEFRRMLTRWQPDGLIINACGRKRFWMLPWLARLAGIPCLWVQQMVDGCDHRRMKPKWFGGQVEGLSFWRVPQTLRHYAAAVAATAVVTLNAEDKERIVRWQRVARDKIRVIPHGVDCEQFRFDPAGRAQWHKQWGLDQNTSPKPLVIGSACRLSPEKGADLLIEATAMLKNRGLPILTVIAGQGDQKEHLLNMTRSLDIATNVRFIDFVSDMPGFYSALDVFVLSSRTESFGLALAEAMACERAVVGTPTSGALRQIDDPHTGRALRTFEPQELADVLEQLYTDAETRDKMGIVGRRCVQDTFSIDLTLERALRALRDGSRQTMRLSWPGMEQMPYLAMTSEDRP